jgi:hypothetical protein
LPAGGEQAGIEGRFALVLFHDFLALIEDAFDGVALLAARWLAEQIEYLLQAPDLAFRLVMMFFECRPKLVGVGRLGQRFLVSNHIMRRRRVCMTKCG